MLETTFGGNLLLYGIAAVDVNAERCSRFAIHNIAFDLVTTRSFLTMM